jgi:GNAT superfamily N-acetyltransferase
MPDFLVGAYSIEEFKKYYKTLFDLQEYYVSRGSRSPEHFELGRDEEQHVERDSNHLIIWVDDGKIVGHCIWHETSTDEMIPGDSRDDDDRDHLRHLFGEKKENLVELHELWLKSEHRGKGHGRQFFDFFEDYVSVGGFDGIVYYTDHEAAIALCRKRGYNEAFLESAGLHVFTLPLSID